MATQFRREDLPVLREGGSLNAAQIQVLSRALGSLFPRTEFSCSGPFCSCSGYDDCIDMFGAGVCGDAICFDTDGGGVVCFCIRNWQTRIE